MSFIKWIRLQEICEFIVGRPVDITLSTMVVEDVIAMSSFNNKYVHIVLNAKKCKGGKKILKALAHELAHVSLGDNTHGGKFNQEWEEIEKRLTSQYI